MLAEECEAAEDALSHPATAARVFGRLVLHVGFVKA